MLKFLLLVGLIVIAIWLYRKGNVSRQTDQPQMPPDPESMVTCAHCGVRFPASESLQSEALHYCCDEHRRAGLR